MKNNLTLWQEKYPEHEPHTPHFNSGLKVNEYWSSCPLCKEGFDRVSIFEGTANMVAVCRGKEQGRNGCSHKFYRKDFGGTPNSATPRVVTAPLKPQSFTKEYLKQFHDNIFKNKYSTVLAYAKSRGLDEQIIKRFKLGAGFNQETFGLIFPVPFENGYYMQTRVINKKEGNKYINPKGVKPIVGHIKQNSKVVVITEGMVDGYLFADCFNCDVIIMLGKRKFSEITHFCKDYKKVIFASDSDFINKREFIKNLGLSLTKKYRMPLENTILADAKAKGVKDFAEYYETRGRGSFINLFKDCLHVEEERVGEVGSSSKMVVKDVVNKATKTPQELIEKVEEFYINTLEKAKVFIAKFKQVYKIALDTETMPLPEFLTDANAGLIIGKNKIRLLQLYNPDVGVAVFDMVYITDFSLFNFLEEKFILLHNSIFDKRLLLDEGIEITHFFDSMIFAGVALPPPLKANMSFPKEKEHLKPILLNRSKGLKDLSIMYLKQEKYGEFHKGWDKPQLPDQKIIYAKKDVINTYNLADKLLQSFPVEMEKFYNFFMGAYLIVFNIYKNGVRIDLAKLKEMVVEKETTLKRLNKELNINLNSSKQVDEFFKNKYPAIYKKAIKAEMKTEKTGCLSLGKKNIDAFLNILEQEPALQKDIALYKTNKNALSNLKQYLDYCSPDSRIRSSLSLAGAVTGRFTSGKPNLQNIKNDEEGTESLRSLFLTEENKTFILADFAQQEIRIFALLAKDEQLIKAIDGKLDVHGFIASTAFGVEYKGKHTENRKIAKSLTFSILYGAGITSLAEKLQIPVKQAKDLRKKLLNVFPSLNDLKKKLSQKWHSEKKIKIAIGEGQNRYIYDPNKYSSEHVLLNYAVQGAGASVMIQAMSLWQQRYGSSKDCTIVNSIHDELIFSVTEGKEEEWSQKITETMEDSFVSVLEDSARWKGNLLDITVTQSFSKQKIRTTSKKEILL